MCCGLVPSVALLGPILVLSLGRQILAMVINAMYVLVLCPPGWGTLLPVWVRGWWGRLCLLLGRDFPRLLSRWARGAPNRSLW